MNRAKPVDMRKALETVQALKDAGILFVPVPIMNEAQHEQLKVMFNNALAEIGKQCEVTK
jgi:hypothetical protein